MLDATSQPRGYAVWCNIVAIQYTVHVALYSYHHESLHTDSPWVGDVLYWFWDQRDSKVKVAMLGLLKMVSNI